QLEDHGDPSAEEHVDREKLCDLLERRDTLFLLPLPIVPLRVGDVRIQPRAVATVNIEMFWGGRPGRFCEWRRGRRFVRERYRAHGALDPFCEQLGIFRSRMRHG